MKMGCMVYRTENVKVTVNTWTDKALKYSIVHDTYMLSSLIIYHGREELVSHSQTSKWSIKATEEGQIAMAIDTQKTKLEKVRNHEFSRE